MSDEALRDAARRSLADVDLDVGFAWAVVEGLVDGELWADRPSDPRAFHAVHPCGMSLVWGRDVARVADGAVRHIRERAARGTGEWLQIDQRWHGLDWDRMLDAVPLEQAAASGVSAGTVRRTRLNFAFDPGAFRAGRRDAAGTGTGVGTAQATVRRATAADFAWQGSNAPERFWPDAGAFLTHGGGWVAEVDGAPAALCFTAFRTGVDVEIGIETHPAFRRRGLARVACAAMIGDVLAADLAPVWSCREDNTASTGLAATLGFAVSRRLPYFEVRAAPA